MTAAPAAPPGLIKCVVWDIDHTLLAGVYLESPGRPPAPDPELVTVARALDARGILAALASKNPAEAVDYVTKATGLRFAAAQCGWGRKSDAILRITGELGLGPEAVAFVDDDLMERAEVSAALPGVLVLSPEDAAEALSWPEFSPAVLTAEGRRRGELYAQRRRRQEDARRFGGSREEFLRRAGTRAEIAPARPADLPRLHELSVRTHQFNSSGQPVTEVALAAALDSPGQRLVTVRLRDRYGDDGLVGAALMDTAPAGAAWTARLLMMSCRALGRGVMEALLAWLIGQAAAGGATELRVPCVISERNVPLRLALAAGGFRAADSADPARPGGDPGENLVVFAWTGGGSPRDLPGLPDWVIARDGP